MVQCVLTTSLPPCLPPPLFDLQLTNVQAIILPNKLPTKGRSHPTPVLHRFVPSSPIAFCLHQHGSLPPLIALGTLKYYFYRILLPECSPPIPAAHSRRKPYLPLSINIRGVLFCRRQHTTLSNVRYVSATLSTLSSCLLPKPLPLLPFLSAFFLPTASLIFAGYLVHVRPILTCFVALIQQYFIGNDFPAVAHGNISLLPACPRHSFIFPPVPRSKYDMYSANSSTTPISDAFASNQ